MSDEPLARRLELTLRPDPARTVLRPFDLSTPADREKHAGRLNRIVQQLRDTDEEHLQRGLSFTRARLEGRHRDFDATLRGNADAMAALVPALRDLDDERRYLFGGFVSQEFAYESAALFNPSAMEHVSQHRIPEGSLRLIVSLRGVGEGHVSSVTFRSLVWDGDAGLEIEHDDAVALSPAVEERDGGAARVTFPNADKVAQCVLYPVLPSQRRGLEDMRLTRLIEPDGRVRHLGTFTAVDGDGSCLQLMEGHEFAEFDLWPIKGEIAASKGGALFPRRIGEQYLMVTRQDGESLFLSESDDLIEWRVRGPLLAPKYPWEYAQIGNCGAPIELDEGWLLLTHGVGAMRKYSIGAVLLDKDDPCKVIGRTREPLLAAADQDREGYVPNVVYTCGAVKHRDTLFMPYGIADSSVGFAFVAIKELLATM